MSSLSPDRLTFPLFGKLAAEDAAVLAPLLRRRDVAAGEVVFARGDAAEEVYLVVSGQLRISVVSQDGRELAFRLVGAGQMVGELAVLDGSRRSADLTALRRSELLGLDRRNLQGLIATRSAMAAGVIAFLCRRVRDTSEQLETLALQRIETRLARYLLRLAGSAASPHGEVELISDVSQSEIGALIGASRPKVNIAFTALEKRGALRRVGRNLVCRVDALSEIAEMPEV